MSKITFITGGSRGIGKEIVLHLAAKGDHVIFTYHSNKNAADAVIASAEGLKGQVTALQLDTRNTSDFPSFINRLRETLQKSFGTDRIDYLINNAGTGAYAAIHDTKEAQFDDLVNIHFKGVYFLTQAMLPIMNDGGGIVNVSSGLTRFSFPGFAAYASMKGAIEVFTRYLAKELGERGIRANTLAPGAIATDFGGGANKDPEKTGIIASVTALGRIGEADDIAGVVGFLCSEEAKWVNGQRIEASGGMLV